MVRLLDTMDMVEHAAHAVQRGKPSTGRGGDLCQWLDPCLTKCISFATERMAADRAQLTLARLSAATHRQLRQATIRSPFRFERGTWYDRIVHFQTVAQCPSSFRNVPEAAI